MSNADNSGNNANETFFNVPESKYFFISRSHQGIAVHKGFFKWYSLTLALFFSISTAILCLTNWWQTAAVMIITTLFLGKLWFIGWPAVLISIPVFYFWYKRRQARLLRERKSRREMRRKLAFLNS
jgi:hypothetical protein